MCEQTKISATRTTLRKWAQTVVLLAMVSVSACATRPPVDDPLALAAYRETNDPLEPMNRATFGFNQALGKVVLTPIARGYRFIVPKPARRGLGNALHNLRSPVILANDLLQAEGKRASDTFVRFLINTTLGLAGLFDVAKKFGIEGHDEDFGQTLAVWGFGEGPYLVLPIFGPSSPRDGIGRIGDIVMDPVFWIIRSSDEDYLNYVRTGVEGIDDLEQNLDELGELERSSLDFYAAMRTRYRENRAGEIRNGADVPLELPDYLDDEEMGGEGPAKETKEEPKEGPKIGTDDER